MIPVAGNHYAAVVQFQSGGACTLLLHAAEAVEGVALRVVEFSEEGLPDADGLRTASAKEHFAGLQHDREAEVVVVGHLHHVPFTVLEVFCRRGRDKAVGMATSHDILAVDTEHLMSGSRNIQVWQLLYFHFDYRTA